jgi:hypothetical protein
VLEEKYWTESSTYMPLHISRKPTKHEFYVYKRFWSHQFRLLEELNSPPHQLLLTCIKINIHTTAKNTTKQKFDLFNGLWSHVLLEELNGGTRGFSRQRYQLLADM